jgi:hypothetical protein
MSTRTWRGACWASMHADARTIPDWRRLCPGHAWDEQMRCLHCRVVSEPAARPYGARDGTMGTLSGSPMGTFVPYMQTAKPGQGPGKKGVYGPANHSLRTITIKPVSDRVCLRGHVNDYTRNNRGQWYCRSCHREKARVVRGEPRQPQPCYKGHPIEYKVKRSGGYRCMECDRQRNRAKGPRQRSEEYREKRRLADRLRYAARKAALEIA